MTFEQTFNIIKPLTVTYAKDYVKFWLELDDRETIKNYAKELRKMGCSIKLDNEFEWDGISTQGIWNHQMVGYLLLYVPIKNSTQIQKVNDLLQTENDKYKTYFKKIWLEKGFTI